MSRLSIETPGRAQNVLDGLHRDMERRIGASAYGLCPVDMSLNYLRLCHAQTCGKCVPCRIGLGQLEVLIEQVLDRTATMETINIIERTAKVIADSAGCAIGYEAAYMVLKGIRGFREDYEEHVQHGRCISALSYPVPCVSACPAHVDVPGYVALVNEGKYEEAVRLIRKDNPFPSACAYVCVHSCEAHCRRAMVDDAINICGLKRFAVDNAKAEPAKILYEKTGKTVGIIGGGPGGLTAAYYLAQMGHKVTVYEQRPKLGGMLRYGIPDYRLPQEVLERDIEHILTTGINVITDVSIGRDVTMEDIQKSYDAVYISIGAHNDKKIGIEGEDAENVVSAVSLLRRIDEGNAPDFTGKRICVIGGGNVSMDATRTAKRLGAESVTCVYRRRVDDMTALAEEIEEAMAEGCQILPLQAPARIEKDAEGKVAALWTVPQIIGPYGKDGRPKPIPADVPEFRIACDYVIVAIGQAIDARPFEAIGIKTFKGMIQAEDTSSVADVDNVFAGGDAVSGPATVIRAVAAGKVAAANIDAYLGFEHKIKTDVVVPPAHLTNAPPCGRVNLKSHCTPDCKGNFDLVVEGMSRKEADQESERCLRCDYFGFGSFRGGRTGEW
ncbi:FAD-dependent oxidoreductase [Firmicutes bacterium AM29-6AC]|uniref:Glutamate synthase n=1 Tax=Anaerotignum faecicola TaxID=2358141 RepID=A0A401LA13_9FIRM|nr:NAD(P)-binding protein [Anaerotignum faecicola]RHR13669.1 FAD-dependent oxidoreductase [Firmicutes bacterium AF19-2LB]RHT39381.1 FAD-dependent oxidoreductase [Firmicutes bacterium AM29-6AC]GCB28358.1 glutamate synthase [Anaerotignum faecicola]